MSTVDTNLLEFGFVMDGLGETALTVPNNTPRRSGDGDSEEVGRALRARRSLGNTVVTTPKRKRARTFSESHLKNHDERTEGKKQKLEDKKAVGFFSLMYRLTLRLKEVLIRFESMTHAAD